MNVTFDLREFLEFATYRQLFNYVVVPKELAKAVMLSVSVDSAETGKYSICHIEEVNPEMFNIWYPYNNWIKEWNRREEIRLHVYVAKSTETQKPKGTDLLTLIREAAKVGNMEEVERLNNILMERLG